VDKKKGGEGGPRVEVVNTQIREQRGQKLSKGIESDRKNLVGAKKQKTLQNMSKRYVVVVLSEERSVV